jgi:hypothetical protein
VESASVVDLVDEAGKVGCNVLEGFVCHQIHGFDLECLHRGKMTGLRARIRKILLDRQREEAAVQETIEHLISRGPPTARRPPMPSLALSDERYAARQLVGTTLALSRMEFSERTPPKHMPETLLS